VSVTRADIIGGVSDSSGGDEDMASEQIELLSTNFNDLYHSLPERVQRPELLFDDLLKLIFEFGRHEGIMEQLTARATTLEVRDEASYTEAGTILSEAEATRECIREHEKKCDAVFADFELLEKFHDLCTQLSTILGEKMEAWERRDKRRKLTPAQVHEMKSDYDSRKMTMRQLAKRFSISVSTVANIIHGRYWKS
jgi:hypothetical protein